MASTQASASQSQLVPKCGASTTPNVPQNDALHIAALFVVLGVSAGAATFPILASRYPRLGIPHKLLFLLKHFGTGVLVATAFCHLLPTAFLNLLDPCLQSIGPDGLPDGKGVFGLNGSYPALSGAIAMAGVFLVSSVEMGFAELVGGHQRHHHHRSDIADGVRRSSTFGRERNLGSLTGSPAASKIMGKAITSDASEKPSETTLTLSPPTDMNRPGGSSYSRSEMVSGGLESQIVGKKEATSDDEFALDVEEPEKQKEQDKKAVLQCLLLEMGILFHSVFIGLALSVSEGNAFVVLFIAIIFHQTFEGLSLGTRIALLRFPQPTGRQFIPNNIKPYAMACTYGLTTPIGQAIGLGLLFSPATNWDPSGKTELLVVGCANAISSGLLLWAGLVELLSADFFGEERNVGIMKERKWRWIAWLTVMLGACGMAVIGAWA